MCKTDLDKYVGAEQDLEGVVAEQKGGAVVRRTLFHEGGAPGFDLKKI